MTHRSALLIGALALALPTCRETRQSAAAELAQQNTSAQVSESRRTAITQAVQRVAPAVVTIQTEQVERVQTDPFFEWFYGRSATERVVPISQRVAAAEAEPVVSTRGPTANV